MKRQGRLRGIGLSPGSVLPVVGALLSGLVMVLAFTFTVTGCAPETNRGFPPAARAAVSHPQWPGVSEIITRLELEPEQTPAVRTVLEEAEDARAELRAEMMSRIDVGRPDPSAMTAMRGRMDEVDEAAEVKLSGLLSSDQMEEYRRMVREAAQQREAMRPQLAGGRGGRQGMGGW